MTKDTGVEAIMSTSRQLLRLFHESDPRQQDVKILSIPGHVERGEEPPSEKRWHLLRVKGDDSLNVKLWFVSPPVSSNPVTLLHLSTEGELYLFINHFRPPNLVTIEKLTATKLAQKSGKERHRLHETLSQAIRLLGEIEKVKKLTKPS